MKIASDITSLVGHTPLIELARYSKQHKLTACLAAKVEMTNPSGSVKARAALAMIEEAEQRGVLKPGGTIIEPTSGNTGIGLAMVAAVKGYHTILTMPDTMSMERRKLLAAYGAEVVLTEGHLGMAGCIAKAEELHLTTPNSIIPQQFSNRANPQIHERTTALEIWNDTDGKVTAFVAGVGTGGTISGVGRGLKSLNPHIHITAVEPISSPLLKGGKSAPHGLQGIGANFIPENYDASVVDEIIGVSEVDAISTLHALARTEGIFAGISSGAALYAAHQMAMRPEYQNKIIVALLPDGGERYLSCL